MPGCREPPASKDLVVTMEDATSALCSAFLVDEESTASSLRGVGEVVVQHGLYCSLYTDRGSHHFETPEAGGRVSKTVLKPFGRALKQLGIEPIAAYSPQARGRSERVFATLQERLPKEFALAGISAVEAANQWLREVYIAAHNERFAIEAEQEGSVFVIDATEAWRDPVHPGGSNGGQRQYGEMAQAEPATATRPIATALREGKGAGARISGRPVAVFWGPHQLVDYDATGTIIQQQRQAA